MYDADADGWARIGIRAEINDLDGSWDGAAVGRCHEEEGVGVEKEEEVAVVEKEEVVVAEEAGVEAGRLKDSR
jgi:hypothetical protein